MSQSTQQDPFQGLPQGKTFQSLVKMAPLLTVIFFRLHCSSLCGLGFRALACSPGVCECLPTGRHSPLWAGCPSKMLSWGLEVQHCATAAPTYKENQGENWGLGEKKKNKNKKKGNSNTHNKNKSVKLFFPPLWENFPKADLYQPRGCFCTIDLVWKKWLRI